MTTKAQVRADFTHARELMRQAERFLRTSTPGDDYSEAGDAGQLALELVASVTTFAAYLEERDTKAVA